MGGGCVSSGTGEALTGRLGHIASWKPQCLGRCNGSAYIFCSFFGQHRLDRKSLASAPLKLFDELQISNRLKLWGLGTAFAPVTPALSIEILPGASSFGGWVCVTRSMAKRGISFHPVAGKRFSLTLEAFWNKSTSVSGFEAYCIILFWIEAENTSSKNRTFCGLPGAFRASTRPKCV